MPKKVLQFKLSLGGTVQNYHHNYAMIHPTDGKPV